MNNTLIPRDVLLYLTTFLDPFTGNSLRLTCKFLHSVLADTYEKPVTFEIFRSDAVPRCYSMLAQFSVYGWFIIPAFAFVCNMSSETIYEFVFQTHPTKVIIRHDINGKFAHFESYDNYTVPKVTKFIITLSVMRSILAESKRLINENPDHSLMVSYKKLKHIDNRENYLRLWD